MSRPTTGVDLDERDGWFARHYPKPHRWKWWLRATLYAAITAGVLAWLVAVVSFLR